ncbi:MAG: NAD-dependent epimerase/dehydratase family protein [Gammaproteobacteria bacterium]|nr:NAD-dependent epimerase/dehydratase family protein [Gammaproteobacteria bacterium]
MNPDLPDSVVLVTGARGFLGAHLVRALRLAGARVVATSRGQVDVAGGGVEWLSCDPADLAAVQALHRAVRPDYVAHLSSQADGRRDLALVVATLHAETVAAVNMLTAAAEHGVKRLVLPGSLDEPLSGAAPASPYGAAKGATRGYAQLFWNLYRTPVVTARVMMAYGPGQPAWKLIPSTIACFSRGEPPTVESPDRLMDWVYVDDVVAGLVKILTAPGIDGGRVDLGSGGLTSVREIVGKLGRLVNPAVEPRYGVGTPRGSIEPQAADLAGTARQIGWSPLVSLDEGLRRTVAALR